jgi:hypothetical protein
MSSLLLALLIAAAGNANLAWQAQFRLVYDDNPFEYSPSDIDKFMMRIEPSRFPIRTIDDLDANAVLGLSWRYRLLDRNGSLGVKARLHQYVSNWQKSYALAEVDAGQQLWQTGRLILGYLYLPNYLLRYFPRPGSPDSTDFVDCRFSEHKLDIGLRQRVGPLVLTPAYAFEIDTYQAMFSYYNTRAHRPGLGVDWEIARNLALSVDYELKLAQAQGPVPDVSYLQHKGGVSVSTRPLRADRFGLSAGYSFARREFTTANSGTTDPAHAGRVDQIESARVEAEYRFDAVTFVAGYEFEWRQTNSPHSDQIADVKDYRSSRVSIGAAVNSRKAR